MYFLGLSIIPFVLKKAKYIETDTLYKVQILQSYYNDLEVISDC